MKPTRLTLICFLCALLSGPALTQSSQPESNPEYTVLFTGDERLPITVFKITFRAGSADDTEFGIVSLTARMIREGGVRAWRDLPARSRSQLEDTFMPLAADVQVMTSKEQTTLSVTVAAEDSMAVLKLLAQMVVSPAFDPAEFDRIRAEEVDFISKRAPFEDQEELGKFALDRAIYDGLHPYSHLAQGSLSGLQRITLDQVKNIYRTLFVQERLTVGVAGQVSVELGNSLSTIFAELPVGTPHLEVNGAPSIRLGNPLLIVEGKFEGVGVHLGHANPFTRASNLYPALLLGNTAFGKHRSFVGRLMKVVREIRGLNYGTYSYIEDFPYGSRLMNPPTQVARSQQAFTVWGRPTTLENGCFLLRQLHREITNLSHFGITEKEFELTKSHLVGQLPILGSPIEAQLGYYMDSFFYHTADDFLNHAAKEIAALTRDQVNAALRELVHPDHLVIVVVTPDAARFKKEILSDSCPIKYADGVTQPAEILREDEIISKYRLPTTEDMINVVQAEELFK